MSFFSGRSLWGGLIDSPPLIRHLILSFVVDLAGCLWGGTARRRTGNYFTGEPVPEVLSQRRPRIEAHHPLPLPPDEKPCH